MGSLKKGILVSYFSVFITIISGILITPLIVSTLGANEYGVYIYLSASFGLCSVFNLCVNQTFTRFIVNNTDEKLYIKVLTNLLTIVLLIVLFIIIFVILLFYNFKKQQTLVVTELNLSYYCLFLSIIVVLRLLNECFLGIYIAFKEYVYPQAIRILFAVLRIVLIFVLLPNFSNLFFIFSLDLFVSLMSSIFLILPLIKKNRLVFDSSCIKIKELKIILYFMLGILAISLVNFLRWKFGELLLGFHGLYADVTVFSLSVMLGSYIGAFTSSFSNLLLPNINEIYINSGLKGVESEVIRVSRYVAFIVTLILTSFILIGQVFVEIWLKGEYPMVWNFSLFIMASLGVLLIQSSFNTYLQIINEHGKRSVLFLIPTLLTMILGILLVKSGGIKLMVSMACTSILIGVILSNIYYSRLGFNMLHYYKKVLFIPTVYTIIVLTIKLVFDDISNVTSFVLVFINTILVYRFVISNTERKFLKSLLSQNKI
ncbi:hypothetical protein K4L44_09865 [Halosquirtibacter laminarini]|uniref:Uncharacterized protein n=1 Tax=Halosquirtibacter laminarini TaxID=3374600 RepID=A0AC61NBR1_9BACT|nr:hypothetical protein K4L44_09865 [Prolixibacteraceae bacterium]